MYFKPSQAYAKIFTLTGLDGELVAADALPSAAAYRNGVLDAAFALTVAALAAGKYAVTGTVPAGYAQDDLVEIVVDATIATVATAEAIDRFQIETRLDAIQARTDNLPLDTSEALLQLIAYVDELESRLTEPRAAALDEIAVLKKYAANKKALVKTGAVWSLVIYDDDGTTPLLTKALADKDGNTITDPAAGTIAREAAGV
jgi:hypothetical protein